MYLAPVPQPKSLPRVQQRLLQVELLVTDLQNLLGSSQGQGRGWVWLLVLLYRKRNPRFLVGAGENREETGYNACLPSQTLACAETRYLFSLQITWNHTAEETEGFWEVSGFLMQIAHLLLASSFSVSFPTYSLHRMAPSTTTTLCA